MKNKIFCFFAILIGIISISVCLLNNRNKMGYTTIHENLDNSFFNNIINASNVYYINPASINRYFSILHI